MIGKIRCLTEWRCRPAATWVHAVGLEDQLLMKTMRYWVFAVVTALAMLLPLQGANAWDSRGYRGHGGYWSNHSGRWDGYSHRHYYRGCRGCDAAGAAIVGLAIGGIIGSAMVEASRPPVRYAPRYYGPPERCTPVVIDGATYYNCDRDDWRD